MTGRLGRTPRWVQDLSPRGISQTMLWPMAYPRRWYVQRRRPCRPRNRNEGPWPREGGEPRRPGARCLALWSQRCRPGRQLGTEGSLTGRHDPDFPRSARSRPSLGQTPSSRHLGAATPRPNWRAYAWLPVGSKRHRDRSATCGKPRAQPRISPTAGTSVGGGTDIRAGTEGVHDQVQDQGAGLLGIGQVLEHHVTVAPNGQEVRHHHPIFGLQV